MIRNTVVWVVCKTQKMHELNSYYKQCHSVTGTHTTNAEKMYFAHDPGLCTWSLLSFSQLQVLHSLKKPLPEIQQYYLFFNDIMARDAPIIGR